MRFLLWLAVRLLTRLLVLPTADDGTKDLEILVLRQQLGVLRRKTGRPGSSQATGSCWPLPAVRSRRRWASLLVTPQTRCSDPEAADDIDFGIAVWD
jgi:hypothetical protein